MNRFIKWLGTRLLTDESAAAPAPVRRRIEVGNPPGRPAETRRQRQNNVTTKPQEPELVEVDTDLVGHIESIGPGKNVLVRHHELRNESGSTDTLEIVDDSVAEPGNAAGFDPYNTGRFDRGEHWRSREWK